MQVRKPVVAGQFYPADRTSCLGEVQECLSARALPDQLPDSIVAGIVPHAGWMFSGALAAMVFSAVKRRQEQVGTFVICGAAHSYYGAEPAVDDSDAWATPLGDVQVDRELVARLVDQGCVVADNSAHRHEHSIEVQVPFVQHLFPAAKLLPLVVPPNEQPLAVGRALARLCSDSPAKPVYIGPTDLTHYGPRYGFAPMGAGTEALEWAGAVNDQQFIDLALELAPERLLACAAQDCSACGPGAAAAVIAAAKALGKTSGVLLAHDTSNDVMLRKLGTTSQDSVGYAAIVF